MIAALTLSIALALMGLGLFWLQSVRQADGFGFPLDDSWIHLQIARNLASGAGWSFNPGVPTGAATSPLWVLVLAPLFYLGGDITVWVKAVGILLYLAVIMLVASVATQVTNDRRVGLVAGGLAALQPAFLWAALSGMETMLYLTLFLLSLRSLLSVERRGAAAAYASTAWLALAGWARPELWAMLPLFWGYLWWRRRDLSVGRWWMHGGIALLATGSFAAFNMALWNHPTPATLMAKQAHIGTLNQSLNFTDMLAWLTGFIINIDLILRSQNIVLLTCMVGLVLLVQQHSAVGQRLLLCLGIVVLGIVVVLLVNVGGVSFQSFRRSAHLLAAMNVLVAAGFVAIYHLLRRSSLAADAGLEGQGDALPRPWLRPRRDRWRDIVLLSLAGMALLIQIYAVRVWASRFGNDVRSINQADVAAGMWLAANTQAGALVAANDVGAIAYFSQRPVFDMIGLASPESIDVLRRTLRMSEERDRQMKELLLAQQVDYVVIFPAWFPWLAQDPMLHEVHRFTVAKASALASDEVVIYRLQRAP